ncbi:MAG: hypothetical protein HOI95_14765 [Chromatiales bacterium]|nr:hypothetical protein [Chromatiales bacterium]
MSRLSEISRDTLSNEQRAVLDAIESGPRGKMGLVGPFSVYVRAPSVGMAVQNLGAAVRFGTELPENAKEVGICTVGAFYHSKFEFAAHKALGKKAGVADDIIESIRVGAQPTFQRDDERVAYQVARQLLEQHRIGDDILNHYFVAGVGIFH